MTWIEKTFSRERLIPSAVLGGVSLTAFVVFLFTIGGGSPSGPGVFLALAVLALGEVLNQLYQAARSLVVETESSVGQVEQAVGLRRKELERELQAVKRALKELELDHAMGKLSEDDYTEFRLRYRDRAVRIMRQLDQGPKDTVRKQIEQDLAARRAAKKTSASETKGPSAEEMQARLGCPKCSTRNEADATFCKKCGTRLSEA